MRYASIDKIECRNGLGWGVTLYVQGCHFHCPNCFNPETWDFNGGKEFTQDTLNTILKLIEPEYIKHFTIQGGEPLEKCNWQDLGKLIAKIKKQKPDIKIWLYTGFTYECLEYLMSSNVPGSDRNLLYIILKNVDVLVDGQFQEDKKDLTYPFAGSTNQRVIDMKRTNDCGKIVLFNEE